MVGSLCVSAGATLAGVSWTLPVPSTLSLRLIESSSLAVSSSVFYLEFLFLVYSLPVLRRHFTGVSSPGRHHAVHISLGRAGRCHHRHRRATWLPEEEQATQRDELSGRRCHATATSGLHRSCWTLLFSHGAGTAYAPCSPV